MYYLFTNQNIQRQRNAYYNNNINYRRNIFVMNTHD